MYQPTPNYQGGYTPPVNQFPTFQLQNPSPNPNPNPPNYQGGYTPPPNTNQQFPLPNTNTNQQFPLPNPNTFPIPPTNPNLNPNPPFQPPNTNQQFPLPNPNTFPLPPANPNQNSLYQAPPPTNPNLNTNPQFSHQPSPPPPAQQNYNRPSATPPPTQFNGPNYSQSPTASKYQYMNTTNLLNELYNTNMKFLRVIGANCPFTGYTLNDLYYQSVKIRDALGNMRLCQGVDSLSIYVKDLNDVLWYIGKDPQYKQFADSFKPLIDLMKDVTHYYRYYPSQPPVQQQQQQIIYQQQNTYQQQQNTYYQQPLAQPPMQQQQNIYPPQPPQDPYLQYRWSESDVNEVLSLHKKERAIEVFKGKSWDIDGWTRAYNQFDDYYDEEDPDNEKNNPGIYIVVAAFTNFLLPPLNHAMESNCLIAKENLLSVNQISQTQLKCAKTPASLFSCVPTRYTEICDCRKLRRRYLQTNVYVVNGDTLDVTHSIKKSFSGQRVAVLNMTNPNRPGGWWEKGCFSQEETLFVRTALSRALSPSYYPLGNFTAIYARDVPVIREGLESAYSFLGENEVWNTDFVSVAGVNLYDKKNKGKKPFTDKTAIVVRGKVEAILAACAANNADILVLGALGCGTFCNPPPDIAAIFHAVLLQYAGFFNKVFFAIYDSAEERKEGSAIDEFAEILVDPKYRPGKLSDCEYEHPERLRFSTMYAPYAAWEMPLPPTPIDAEHACDSYGMCANPDPAHYAKEAHPPMCPLGRNCNIENPVHHLMFMHVVPCPKWGLCDILYSGDIAAVRAHIAHFDHPRITHDDTTNYGIPEIIPVVDAPAGTDTAAASAELRKIFSENRFRFCPYAGECTDITEEHLKRFIHLPICGDGVQCEEIGNEAHHKAFRHLKEECPDGTHCMRCFTDLQHWEMTKHSFAEPCPCAPYPCGKEGDPEHMRRYSHMCKYGPECQNTSPDHLHAYFHGSRDFVCPKGDKCKDTSEEHLALFFHPNYSPYNRKPCPKGAGCTNTNVFHKREYTHKVPEIDHAEVHSHNMRDPKPAKDYGVWNERDYPVNFVQNTEAWFSHFTGKFRPNPNDPNYIKVVEWVRGLRPVHMLSADTLLSVAELGSLSSLERLKGLWAEKKKLVACVLARETLIPLLRKISGKSDLRKKLRKYLSLFIRTEQVVFSGKNYIKYKNKIADLIKDDPDKNKNKIAKYAFATTLYDQAKALIPEKEKERVQHRVDIVRAYEDIEAGGGEAFIARFEAESKAMVTALHKLIDPEGYVNIGIAGFENDKIVRTNYTVFAVVGPHLDNYGDAEAALILNQSIMFHPDYYMLPNAATLYSFGSYHNVKYKTGSRMDRTPWMGPSKGFDEDDGGRDKLREQKFHPIDPRWAEAAACELMCRAMCASSIASINDVTLDDVIKYWEGANSHCVIEGHLPASVSLGYVEHAILQKSTRDKLAGHPLGKLLLERWEAAKALQVVSSADEVRKANEAYFMRGGLPACPFRGFTFTLAGETVTESFIPLELPATQPSFAVRFTARGSPFKVTFSNVGDIKGPKDPNNPNDPNATIPRYVVTFALDASGQLLTAHYFNPVACIASNVHKKFVGFNAHTPGSSNNAAGDDYGSSVSREPVHYEVLFDYGKKTLTFRHWGISAAFNDSSLTVDMQDVLFNQPKYNRYSYVSFANSSTDSFLAGPPVIISDLMVVNN